MTELLKHLPMNLGMGFVLVQHLDPVHPSALVELLSKATQLPVREVKQGTRVQPNEIYVIPPNARLSIAKGVLNLAPRGERAEANRAIDRSSIARAGPGAMRDWNHSFGNGHGWDNGPGGDQGGRWDRAGTG